MSIRIASVLLAGGLAAALPAQSLAFAAFLDGSKEVPPTNSTGTAWAEMSYQLGGSMLSIFLATDVDATAVHIHDGAAGQNGPIIFGLTQTGPGEWRGSGTFTRLQEIRFLNGNMYLNVHSQAFPSGEVRGQVGQKLVRRQRDAIDGASVVPPASPGETGSATLSLYQPENRLVYAVRIDDPSEPLVARLRQGATGTNGPHVANLIGGGDRWLGSVLLTDAQVSAFLNEELYVEVSAETDTGAARGRGDPEEKEEFVAFDRLDGGSNFRGYVRTRNYDRQVRVRVGTTDPRATAIELGIAGQPPLVTVTNTTGPGLFAGDVVLTPQQYQTLLTGFVLMTVRSPGGDQASPLLVGPDPLPIGAGTAPIGRGGAAGPYIYASNLAVQAGIDIDIRVVGVPASAPVAVMFGQLTQTPFRFVLGGRPYYWFNDAALFVGAASDGFGNVEMEFDLPFNFGTAALVVQAAAANGMDLVTTPGLGIFIF